MAAIPPSPPPTEWGDRGEIRGTSGDLVASTDRSGESEPGPRPCTSPGASPADSGAKSKGKWSRFAELFRVFRGASHFYFAFGKLELVPMSAEMPFKDEGFSRQGHHV